MKKTAVKSIQKKPKLFDFTSFLTLEGRMIFDAINQHCEKLGIADKVDLYELSMLANAFDLYRINAEICKKEGIGQKSTSGGWNQVRPEYTAMKDQHQHILKHSQKFALNPADRRKIFSITSKQKEDAFDEH